MAAGRSKQRWKEAERETARSLGTERIPNNGRGQPDLVVPGTELHPTIAVQVKTRVGIPAWFSDAVGQSVIDARNTSDDAVPAVVIVHAPGRGIKKQRYVILRFEDAVNLLGTITPAADGGAR